MHKLVTTDSAFIDARLNYETNTEVIRNQGCTNLGHQVAVVAEFCAMTPNVCELSVWNLVYAFLLALRILRWLVGFVKFVYPCLKHI